MSYKPYWKRGAWKAQCDVCGKLFHSDKLKKRWDGFMVCNADYELRHPSDFLKARKERLDIPWQRKEHEDTFIEVPYIAVPERRDPPAYIPGFDQSSWTNPFDPAYRGPPWGGTGPGGPTSIWEGFTVQPIQTGQVGQFYSYQIDTGGIPFQNFIQVSGPIPGMTLSPTGLFSGIPTVPTSNPYVWVIFQAQRVSNNVWYAGILQWQVLPGSEQETGTDAGNEGVFVSFDEVGANEPSWTNVNEN